jgi:hypothetical protein
VRFDFHNPDYLPVIAARIARLKRLRNIPRALAAARLYYRDNPI